MSDETSIEVAFLYGKEKFEYFFCIDDKEMLDAFVEFLGKYYNIDGEFSDKYKHIRKKEFEKEESNKMEE